MKHEPDQSPSGTFWVGTSSRQPLFPGLLRCLLRAAGVPFTCHKERPWLKDGKMRGGGREKRKERKRRKRKEEGKEEEDRHLGTWFKYPMWEASRTLGLSRYMSKWISFVWLKTAWAVFPLLVPKRILSVQSKGVNKWVNAQLNEWMNELHKYQTHQCFFLPSELDLKI